MDIDRLKVIVAGGAIGGAGAALLLAGAGARVTLLEKVMEPRTVGAGIGLAENGAAVLNGIGLGPELEVIGRPVTKLRVVDGGGGTLLAPTEGTPRVLMVRRSDLHKLLWDAVAGQALIDARRGVAVVAAHPRGEVSVRGTDGEDTLRGDLVIGADGVHSLVRDGGNFGARVRRPGISYLRGLVAPGLAREEEAWTAAGLFGSFEVANGTYFYASAGTREGAEAIAARDLGALRAMWARAYPASVEVLGAVGSFADLLINEVVRVDCRRLVDGQLALLGDAAHAMAPNLGQGANSALVDGAVLLDELRRANSLAEALTAYDRRRRPAVRKVAAASARLGALAEITSGPGRWLRDRVLLRVASRGMGDSTTRMVLQESPDALSMMSRA